MRSHHAAALSLLAWYVLSPPVSSAFPRGNLDAPLAEWTKVGSAAYHTNDDCERALDKRRRFTNQHNRQAALKRLANAQCISTGDPRYKGLPAATPAPKP